MREFMLFYFFYGMDFGILIIVVAVDSLISISCSLYSFLAKPVDMIFLFCFYHLPPEALPPRGPGPFLTLPKPQ